MKTDIIEILLSQYGTAEVFGADNNPQIIDYFHEIGENWVDDESTPWCSAFANWVCMKCGYERSKKLTARSWLLIGEETHEPEIGDIVVLSRGKNSWQGHVTFFIRDIGGYIYCLGGNQNNQVTISLYTKEKVLGYRKLKKI